MTIDGVERDIKDSSFIIICNANFCGSGMQFTPDASIYDGKLN